MRWATQITSLILIVCLNAILLVGAVVRDPAPIRPAIDALVHTIDLSLIVSSSLLGAWFWRVGRRGLGIVFGLNLVAIAVSAGLWLRGYIFPPLVLFGADLYWLNLYWICLTRYGGSLYRATRG